MRDEIQRAQERSTVELSACNAALLLWQQQQEQQCPDRISQHLQQRQQQTLGLQQQQQEQQQEHRQQHHRQHHRQQQHPHDDKHPQLQKSDIHEQQLQRQQRLASPQQQGRGVRRGQLPHSAHRALPQSAEQRKVNDELRDQQQSHLLQPPWSASQQQQRISHYSQRTGHRQQQQHKQHNHQQHRRGGRQDLQQQQTVHKEKKQQGECDEFRFFIEASACRQQSSQQREGLLAGKSPQAVEGASLTLPLQVVRREQQQQQRREAAHPPQPLSSLLHPQEQQQQHDSQPQQRRVHTPQQQQHHHEHTHSHLPQRQQLHLVSQKKQHQQQLTLYDCLPNTPQKGHQQLQHSSSSPQPLLGVQEEEQQTPRMQLHRRDSETLYECMLQVLSEELERERCHEKEDPQLHETQRHTGEHRQEKENKRQERDGKAYQGSFPEQRTLVTQCMHASVAATHCDVLTGKSRLSNGRSSAGKRPLQSRLSSLSSSSSSSSSLPSSSCGPFLNEPPKILSPSLCPSSPPSSSLTSSSPTSPSSLPSCPPLRFPHRLSRVTRHTSSSSSYSPSSLFVAPSDLASSSSIFTLSSGFPALKQSPSRSLFPRVSLSSSSSHSVVSHLPPAAASAPQQAAASANAFLPAADLSRRPSIPSACSSHSSSASVVPPELSAADSVRMPYSSGSSSPSSVLPSLLSSFSAAFRRGAPPPTTQYRPCRSSLPVSNVGAKSSRVATSRVDAAASSGTILNACAPSDALPKHRGVPPPQEKEKAESKGRPKRPSYRCASDSELESIRRDLESAWFRRVPPTPPPSPISGALSGVVAGAADVLAPRVQLQQSPTALGGGSPVSEAVSPSAAHANAATASQSASANVSESAEGIEESVKTPTVEGDQSSPAEEVIGAAGGNSTEEGAKEPVLKQPTFSPAEEREVVRSASAANNVMSAGPQPRLHKQRSSCTNRSASFFAALDEAHDEAAAASELLQDVKDVLLATQSPQSAVEDPVQSVLEHPTEIIAAGTSVSASAAAVAAPDSASGNSVATSPHAAPSAVEHSATASPAGVSDAPHALAGARRHGRTSADDAAFRRAALRAACLCLVAAQRRHSCALPLNSVTPRDTDVLNIRRHGSAVPVAAEAPGAVVCAGSGPPSSSSPSGALDSHGPGGIVSTELLASAHTRDARPVLREHRLASPVGLQPSVSGGTTPLACEGDSFSAPAETPCSTPLVVPSTQQQPVVTMLSAQRLPPTDNGAATPAALSPSSSAPAVSPFVQSHPQPQQHHFEPHHQPQQHMQQQHQPLLENSSHSPAPSTEAGAPASPTGRPSCHTDRQWVAVTAYRPVDVVTRTVEVPVVRHVDVLVKRPLVKEKVVAIPKIVPHYVEKIVEVPEVQWVEKVVEIPELFYNTKFVPRPEVRQKIIEQPVYFDKWVERVVEVPRVEEVIRYRDVIEIEEVIKYIPRGHQEEEWRAAPVYSVPPDVAPPLSPKRNASANCPPCPATFPTLHMQPLQQTTAAVSSRLLPPAVVTSAPSFPTQPLIGAPSPPDLLDKPVRELSPLQQPSLSKAVLLQQGLAQQDNVQLPQHMLRCPYQQQYVINQQQRLQQQRQQSGPQCYTFQQQQQPPVQNLPRAVATQVHTVHEMRGIPTFSMLQGPQGGL